MVKTHIIRNNINHLLQLKPNYYHYNEQMQMMPLVLLLDGEKRGGTKEIAGINGKPARRGERNESYSGIEKLRSFWLAILRVEALCG
jgi:hypothetical protein